MQEKLHLHDAYYFEANHLLLALVLGVNALQNYEKYKIKKNSELWKFWELPIQLQLPQPSGNYS